ncbi:MAG: adenylate/guanylate cyclase domain-containing protein [Vampirovibrionales bacterium]|nr:adenylate/guanylate cyclase domain-containing protein [Vampirovibrionales bacterium]
MIAALWKQLQTLSWQEWLRRYALWIVALGLMSLMLVEFSGVVGELLSRTELWHFSQRQRTIMQTRTAARVVVVGLDDYSMTSPMVKQLFGRYPFRRDLYSHVVSYFDRAKAEVLLFDLAFNGGDDLEHPEADAAFAKSVKQATLPVASGVLATQSDQVALSSAESLLYRPQLSVVGDLTKIPLGVRNTLQAPIDILQHTPMRFVLTSGASTDGTGIVRYANLLVATKIHPTAANLYPTLPLATVLALNTKLPVVLNTEDSTIQLGQEAPIPFYKQAIIRWYGDARGVNSYNATGSPMHSQNNIHNSFSLLGPIGNWALHTLQNAGWMKRTVTAEMKNIYPRISLWDVVYSQLHDTCPSRLSESVCQKFLLLEKKNEALGSKKTKLGTYLPPALFVKQRLIVGTTYENAPGDVHPTIYGGPNYHGVYINANIVDNLIHHDFVWRVPNGVTLALSLAFALLMGFTAFKRPILYSAMLAIALVGGYSVFTFWLYQHQNGWINWTIPTLTVMGTFIGAFAVRTWLSERRKQQLRFAFGKYVSPDVMQTIEKDPSAIKLGGQRERLTIMFTDIRGFTKFSEANDPQVVQQVLSNYFRVMLGIILNECGGTINKLIGDAILAYWGFPLAASDDPLKAVMAALRMQQAMSDWNADPANPPLAMGIGIHTGEAVIGNVGSEQFMDFTLIGDAVNLASRLESETKAQTEKRSEAVKIIISQTTYDAVAHMITVKKLGEVQVKGKAEWVSIYEPTGLIESASSVVDLPLEPRRLAP